MARWAPGAGRREGYERDGGGLSAVARVSAAESRGESVECPGCRGTVPAL